MDNIKRIFKNPSFGAGIVVLTIVFLSCGQIYMDTLLRVGYSAEGIPWIEMFRYAVEHERSLLLIPICVPLAAGGNAEAELKSRYAVFSCSRVGRRAYYMGKITEVLLSGGLMVCISELVGLALFYLRCSGLSITIDRAGSFTGSKIVLFLLGVLIRGFLNGGFWALMGSLFSVLSKSIYLAYAVPFVLYYVLTMFQARFYQELYFLSPRYWAAPVLYDNVFCILILLLLELVCGFVFAAVMKRRLGYG